MRISSIPKDKGYIPDWQNFSVSLNGKWLHDCLMADEEERMCLRKIGMGKSFISRGEVKIIKNRRRSYG